MMYPWPAKPPFPIDPGDFEFATEAERRASDRISIVAIIFLYVATFLASVFGLI